MRHLVFLLGSYYPNYSAVGYCVHQVIKCLKNEFDITVIALHNDPLLPSEEIYDGVRILRIESEGIRQRNRTLTNKGKSSTFYLNFIRLRGLLRRLFSPETVDASLVRAYLDCLSKQSLEINSLVPVVFPFETVLAALQYKKINPKAKIVSYLFDDFVDSGSLHVYRFVAFLKRRRHLFLEQKMLEESHAVLAMHPLRDHFEQWFSKELVKKISYLEHPLLIQPRKSNLHLEDGVVHLCFTGSLIRNVREPDYLLQLLRGASFKKSVSAEFYVMGNAANQIKTGKLSDNLEVKNFGKVSKSNADEAIARSNILINIGERTGRQVSSKIFEYMATGKPIIHIAYTHNDSVVKILQRYPLVLCIIKNIDDISNQTRALSEFIEDNYRSNITYDDVAQIFPEALPMTTVRKLLDFDL